MKCITRILAGAAAMLILAAPLHAEVSEISITRQPSVIYLPAVIMEHDHLIEKHAKAMGLGDLKVHWANFTSGAAATDALMAGKVDFINSGMTNMLLLWDRTHGAVKGVAADTVVSEWLLTNNPAVRTIRDFSQQDRIAVPTVKVSVPAVILKMAAEQAFGPAGRDRLDALTVAQGHPDAAIALLSGKSNLDAHFSAPPYQQQELKSAAVHRVLTSADVFGGPLSFGVLFGTTRFHDANPRTYAALLAALREAEDSINRNPVDAARKYLDTTHEKYSVDEVARIITARENTFSMTPHGTRKIADFMHKDGLLKSRPASWKDAWFQEIHALPGS